MTGSITLQFRLFCAGLWLFATAFPALAQQYPVVGPNTVIGRIGNNQSGPAQQIPFSLLAAQLTASGLVNSVPATLSSATVSSGGSGCTASSTFNVTTTAGSLGLAGSQATISVTTNGAGVVTTVNSIISAGLWTLIPPTPNAVAGGNCIVAPKLNLVFSGANAGDAVIIGGNQGTLLDAGAPPALTTRNINTTSPLQGGGNLGADLTLSIVLPVASASVEGIVQTDGSTITNSSGLISCTPATSSQIGCAKPDGITITASAGVITAVGGSATSVTPGTTTVGGSANPGYALTDNSGTLANNKLFSMAGGYINRLRNGTFDVWLRGTSALATSTSGAYTADGWIVTQAGAAFTCSQDTGNNGTLFSLKCVGGTSNTDTTFKQRIESRLAAELAGATITVQFQYKQNTGSSVTPKVSSCFASATDNFTTCTADLAATSLTSCATATWCTESYTLSASASASNGYQITFDCNTALTSAQDCWMTAADVRVTPGVTTGINANPPSPELRIASAELALCERYFQTSYDLGTAPGSATHLGMAGGSPALASSFTFPANVPFGVRMRAAPSVSFWDGAGTASKISVLTSTTTFTDGQTPLNAPFNISTRGFLFTTVANTGSGFIHYAASAEL